jgi:hypothetical protein
MYAAVVIVLFTVVYGAIILKRERKDWKKPPVKVWLKIFGEAFLHSFNVFLNLSYNKTIMRKSVPGFVNVAEAVLGIYFIVFIAMIAGNVLL